MTAKYGGFGVCAGKAIYAPLAAQRMKWTLPPLEAGNMSDWCAVCSIHKTGESVMNVATIGIDLAKNTFSLHGTDAQGKTVLKKTVSNHNDTVVSTNLTRWSAV
jgi:hypothetical protein